MCTSCDGEHQCGACGGESPSCTWCNEAVVCITHKRFIPCRRNREDCVLSSRPLDIEIVRQYQTSKD